MAKKTKAKDHGLVPVSFPAEEPDFPRGGGSCLTSSEIQEAREEAEADFRNEGSLSRKTQKKRTISDEIERAFLSGVPKSVELLRYKSLSIGMKLWGIILEVGRRDVTVSLPGGLRGFVKAVDALDMLFEEEEPEDIPLNELFSEGQLVSCVVIQLDSVKLKENKKQSKRIGLSLKLNLLNKGLTIDAMHEGLLIPAYVTSIEDHGYLVSFGISGITGFLKHSDGLPVLKKRQLVQGVVRSIDKKRAMVLLMTEPEIVSSTVAKEMEGLTMELLLPGTLVNARVRSIVKNGLLLSFLTYFTGMVSIFHLDDPLPPTNWQENYSENQRVKARVLYVDNTSKTIGLSLNSQLVQNMRPLLDVNIGDLYNNAIVRRVDATLGILLELGAERKSTAGYAHISDASDEHIKKLQDMFKEDQVVKARVIGKRLMDGLAIVTLKDSKVKQRFLSYVDIHPGMPVLGEIISVEAFGAFVKLADGLRAFCPLQHMSELKRSKPSSKFKVGAKLKFKILTCEPDTKKITLTHKRTMLMSKLSPVTSYEGAVEGLLTHGWISGIEDYGCFVCFYNNVRGLVHRTELGLDPGVDSKSVFEIGQVVKCRVLRVDASAQRLSLSFVLSPSRLLDLQSFAVDDEKALSVGDKVSGLVATVSESLITLDVPLPNRVARAFMRVELLSDFAGHSEQLRSLLFPGYKFEHLLILEKDGQKFVVTSKFSLLSAVFLPSDISQLNSQEVIHGYIASITDKGCFVRFVGGLTGLASLPQLVDGFALDPYKHFSVGQSVRAKVLQVNLESGRFNLSLKQSDCFSTDTNYLKGYFLEEEMIAALQALKMDGSDSEWGESIHVGKLIEVEIQDIKEYGVIVNVQDHNDVVGFVTHHQLDSEVHVGDRAMARILDVVKSDGILDLTLRSHLVTSGSALTSHVRKVGRKRTRGGMEIRQKTVAVIELIKDEYLVCSLPDFNDAIAFASAHDYNVKVDPHEKYKLGQRVEVFIGSLSDKNGRILLLLASFSESTGNFLSKRMKCPSKLGTLIRGEVFSIGPLEMKVKVDKNTIGKVHVSQVRDEFKEENPFSCYTLGQQISGRILRQSKQVHDGHLTTCYDLTLKPSALACEAKEGLNNFNILSPANFQLGQIVTAYVKDLHDDWVWLLIAPSIMGRLFVLDSSTDPIQLSQFRARFKIGQPIRCRIAKIDFENGKMDFSLRGMESSDASQAVDEVRMYDVIGGRISKIFPEVGGLSVQVGCSHFGRVHVTHLHDVWKDNPVRDFEVGQFVRCMVLDMSKTEDGLIDHIDLSLRTSLVNACIDGGASGLMNKRFSSLTTVETIEDLRVDMEVQGYVKSVVKKGCFVTLSRHLDVKIKLSNLADSFVPDPEGLFPVGKLVKGRIISVEHLSGFVEMSLRSALSKDEKRLTLKDIHDGHVVHGVVIRIETYGLFISIINSNCVGLCHISQVSFDRINNLEAHFKIGDRVQAKVLKVDEEKRQISLTIKGAPSKSMVVEEEVANKGNDFVHLEGLSSKQEPEKKLQNLSYGSSVPDPPMNDFTVFDASVQPLDVIVDADKTEISQALTTDDKTESFQMMEVNQKSSKRMKKRMKDLREIAIREAERKRLEGDEAPATTEDFEKLVHASPNSSFIWIKYMAFVLSLGDTEKARNIAERALQTIIFHEEGEKLNVWVALLNLENAYGNPAKEATLVVFRRALQVCDPKKLYMALLSIYERSGQPAMVDELLKTMLQKFKMSCKVWLKRMQYFLGQGMPEAAHKTLDRALLSLPVRKHIKAISHAAISEFKVGSVEHARNLFEGILRNYPKRVDLWSVYLDQELGLGDASVVRALFERVTSLELPPKKMKFLFKKYLDYEKSHGNQEQEEYVKGKAMQYVESKIG